MALLKGKARIRANLVAFVILGIGLSYAMAGQVLSILKDTYSVYAIFPNSGGVFTSQEVTYRGITVGRVGSMHVVPPGVRIELKIDEGTEIPAKDVEARVMFKSAVGEQFVDLLPASDGEPYLKDGSVIPKDQTSIPVSTQAFLSTLEAVLQGIPPRQLGATVNSLGVALTGRGPDLARILESTADISETFAERAPQVSGILRNGTRVGGAFLRSRRNFARAINDLVTVSQTLEQSRNDLARLMRGANMTSDEVLALLRRYRGPLHRFLIEFAEVNALQARHTGDLSAIFRDLPTALALLNRTFEPNGMVRFGLVQDDRNHACSYGTARRPPQDRSDRLPPKNAWCTGSPDGQGAGGSGGGAPFAESRASGDSSGGGLLPLPELPSGLGNSSWTVPYLNGLGL